VVIEEAVMSGLDKIKGKAKEVVGGVTGSDGLRAEGQAQQLKHDEEEKAAEARRLAERHEERAARHAEKEQRHQGT
jgi:uncharacterized protein YjbJ (UPF0337 family)